MNGPYKTFCGLNKYQMFCTACAGLLILVCYRSAQPYPEFIVPATQLVQRQVLPASNFASEEFLPVGPHWADSNRDTFRMHPDYAQLVIGKGIVVHIPPKPPVPGRNPEKDNADQKEDQQEADQTGGGSENPYSTAEAKPDILLLLEEVDRAKPFRPNLQASDDLQSSGTEPILLSPTNPPVPTLTEPVPEHVAVAASDPYRLPFRLEGIVKAKERAPPQVILHDLQTGKRVRRFQGQKYGGVIINKIGPGTVEVEVPTESLQLRYIDTAHRWVTM